MWIFVLFVIGGVSMLMVALPADWPFLWWFLANGHALLAVVVGGLGLYQYFDDWLFWRRHKKEV